MALTGLRWNGLAECRRIVQNCDNGTASLLLQLLVLLLLVQLLLVLVVVLRVRAVLVVRTYIAGLVVLVVKLPRHLPGCRSQPA